MEYTVHIYPVVVVAVRRIRARSQREAIALAEKWTNLHEIIDCPQFEYAEELNCFHVDEEGDTDYSQSRWYNADEHLTIMDKA